MHSIEHALPIVSVVWACKFPTTFFKKAFGSLALAYATTGAAYKDQAVGVVASNVNPVQTRICGNFAKNGIVACARFRCGRRFGVATLVAYYTTPEIWLDKLPLVRGWTRRLVWARGLGARWGWH